MRQLILAILFCCSFSVPLMAAPKHNQTQIILLIDGLGWDQFELMMKANKLPQLRHFFGPLKSNNVYQGRASFPSLTFNNITTILTGDGMEFSPIKGNKNIFGDDIVNFESPFTSGVLKKIVQPQSIFANQEKKALENWAFSYSFHFSESLKLRPNLKIGFQYLVENYRAIDKEMLELALDQFKKNQHWPPFVFIHLIGLDAINHLKGPSSAESLKYFKELDHELKSLFDYLAKEEKKHTLGTMLISDHGFTQIKKNHSLEKIILANIPDDKKTPLIINESRFAGICFSENWSTSERNQLLETISTSDSVMGWAHLHNNELTINTMKQIEKYKLSKSDGCLHTHSLLTPVEKNGLLINTPKSLCPEELDQLYKQKNILSFYENITAYFANQKGPNAIIFANDDVSFQEKYIGDHGGMTEQEMLTPFIVRNIQLNEKETSPIPTYKALRLLKLRSPLAH